MVKLHLLVSLKDTSSGDLLNASRRVDDDTFRDATLLIIGPLPPVSNKALKTNLPFASRTLSPVARTCGTTGRPGWVLMLAMSTTGSLVQYR